MDNEPITIVTPFDLGLFEFTTLTGSVYRLEVTDEKTVITRMPGMKHPPEDLTVERLRRDFEPVNVIQWRPVQVGLPGVFLLEPLSGPSDGVHVTERVTSLITGITRP